MSEQLDLFNQKQSIDPISAPASDAPRLRGQNKTILDALLDGPKTNAQLAQIALKYTSRLSDIRKWLSTWRPTWHVKSQSLGDGLWQYWIEKQ